MSRADNGEWIYRPLEEVQAKANAGEVAAMAELGRRLDEGVDGAERDWAAARVWYEKAAAKGNGPPGARLEVGAIGRGGEIAIARRLQGHRSRNRSLSLSRSRSLRHEWEEHENDYENEND